MSKYGASDITVLEGLDAVRKRPGMYIGSTSERGLHHLVYEVVDNSVDEALAGHCDLIEVKILQGDSIEVTDNGRGIPVAIHPKHNRSALDLVMTVLHAGGKFEKNGYKVSGGLHGVGVSVVNALSSELFVEVKRDGYVYNQNYKLGVPQGEVKEIGPSSETGTKIRFKPEASIFETTVFDFKILAKRCRELAYLNKGLRIKVSDLRTIESKTEDFFFEGGILDFVKDISKNQQLIIEKPIYMSGSNDEASIEISMTYSDSQKETIFSFVNNINTHEGGTHVSGFKSSLTRVFNDIAKELNIFKNQDGFSGSDVREGLISIISIKIPEPQFEGQTKTKLGNSKIAGVVSGIVLEKLKEHFFDYPKDAKLLLERMQLSKRAREAAKKAREMVLRKSPLEVSTLPGKLSDCSSKDPKESEIFLVEGVSAGGTAKGGRDRRTQAILPLRGKVLNVEKSGLSKALSNEEIRSMVTAFGAGIGDEFDISKLRYYKIIIMTDADVDGAHIRTLILTFFYRYMKDLIDNGHVFIAQPPLYGIKQGKKLKYCFDEKSLHEGIKDLAEKSYEIQRYKGLGEMNAEQLSETTMEKSNRQLLKITVDDAIEADNLFSMLMGDEVQERRKFIEDNAIKVKNLDI
jgi:DNA gyrase subunit B